MPDAVYNKIGKTYDCTRRADPTIVKKIIELLQPKANEKFLDIGCGSGNYTGALTKEGLRIAGIDLSEEMLAKAHEKNPDIIFHQGDARTTSFPDTTFDGVTCVFATHHIGNNRQLFPEVFRILNRGRFVIFTATPEQMSHYWLRHYFPEMIDDSAKMMASFEALKMDLEYAGFQNIGQHKFFITNELQDWFLQAGKYRPEIYLDPIVRQGISSFHLAITPQKLQQGLAKLQADIASGQIKNIINDYESDSGDCLFVVGEK